MNTYAIGDVQGCFEPLKALMSRIEDETPHARYLLAGDLVNRGPQSLETLRFVRDLKERAISVLGNHDLHLLAVAAGARKKQSLGSLQAVLDAPDADELIHWLRHRPMVHVEKGHLLVHAGVLPQWTLEQVLSLGKEVESVLQGPGWISFMQEMYGDEPLSWRDDLAGADRLRCIVNGLTRLRFCSEAGEMEFETKEGLSEAPPGFVPWFEVEWRKTRHETIIFGHWSTLGLLLRPNLIALDTGCVWGRQLTAMRLEDRALFQVDCPVFCAQDGLSVSH
ncbi:symmetrical bis(5'-nucleosyl)-tetraphosphatase [Oxalobacter sp. OttesenSCG-928-P03]|nr:symmetrical bis(5'-nucleosyl)-tetraphosphatase [Oxalobacter sp. OttesenSCG-928-P03]